MDRLAEAERVFGREQVELGRRYARPLYAVRLANTLVSLAVLAVLAWTRVGDRLAGAVDSLPRPAATVLVAALSLLALSLATLPLSLWAGLVRERRYGLSTQSAGGWLADRAKGFVIGVVLAGGALVALGALVRLAPDWWPLLAAVAGGALVVLLGFLAPVVLEPLFNRFRPLPDPELTARLQLLAARAGVAVRDVLVSDASRRTRKLNAYVSGVGATRRVVVFDTLLEGATPAEVEAVVAHELAHRRERHVERFAAMGVAAVALVVALLGLVLGDRAGEPRHVPHVLLAVGALQLALAPVFARVSRGFERTADRAAVELTGDAAGVESMFRTLAAANLADLAPPRVLHALFASHPSLPERVLAARTHARSGRAGGRTPDVAAQDRSGTGADGG